MPKKKSEQYNWDDPRVQRSLKACVASGMTATDIAHRFGVAATTMANLLDRLGYRILRRQRGRKAALRRASGGAEHGVAGSSREIGDPSFEHSKGADS